MNNLSLISLITPTFNTESKIVEFLDSVKRQDYPKKLIEIIIVDNGSKDNSIIVVKNWLEKNKIFYATNLIDLKSNLGIASAYNIGYGAISRESKVIIRTESDVELETNCISQLVETLVSDENYGLIGARGVLFYDRTKIDHAARYINWWNGYVEGKDPSKLTECDIVFGGTFAVKNSIVQKLGCFFKEDRFLANEADICMRIKSMGYKVLCQPEAVSYHKVGNTTNQLRANKFQFINHRETILFHIEFNPFPSKIVCLSYSFLNYSINLLKLNYYPLSGFISAVISSVFKRDMFVPYKSGDGEIAKWLLN